MRTSWPKDGGHVSLDSVLSFDAMARSTVNLTLSAVNSSPLWNFTPRRSLISHVFGFRFFHDSARRGFSSIVCGSRVRSPSPISPRIEPLRTDRSWCGSIVSGDDGKAMVSVGFFFAWARATPGTATTTAPAAADLSKSRRVSMCPPWNLGKPGRGFRLLRQLGEKLQHGAIEGLGLVAVAEVSGGRKQHEARVRDLLGHYAHGAKRSVPVAAQ